MFGNEINPDDQVNNQQEGNPEIDPENNQHIGNPEILTKVKELLDDKETIQKIMENFNKEKESKAEYEKNREKRIDMLLELAGTTEQEYMTAIKNATTRGYTILLARDIDEGYINPFIPEWLEAWDGNIDTQPCFDFFGVITYITDYLTKDDTGLTKIL